MEKIKGISRQNKVWVVRLFFRNKKPLIYKRFKDSDYNNSKSKSFEAAKKYAEKKTEEIKNKYICPTHKYKNKPSVRNTSGIVGVHKQKAWGGRANNRKPLDHYVWVASWYEGSCIKTKRFSEKKYGPETAKHLAIEARLTALEELGITFDD